MQIIRRDRAMVAITLMLDIAFHAGRTGTVSAGDIAERLGLARRGMEPRGPKGGYRLGRPQRDIKLAEIVGIALADDEDGGHGPTGRLQSAVVDPLFAELDEAAHIRLQALTLDDLLRRAAAAGLRRPAAEPINFAI